MTFRMKPEYNRKGRASASAGSGATDKEKLHLSEVGPSGHTPLFLKKENQGKGNPHGPRDNNNIQQYSPS